MRRRGSVVAALCIAVLMVGAVPATAKQHQHQHAEGHWSYYTYVDDVKEVGCNQILTTHEDSIFTGTIDGDATSQNSRIVIRCNGDVSYRGVLVFEEATVAGRTGGLVIMAAGRAPAPADHWTGVWVIVSATGELAGLRGGGLWWGPGAGGPYAWGDIDYGGRIHF